MNFCFNSLCQIQEIFYSYFESQEYFSSGHCSLEATQTYLIPLQNHEIPYAITLTTVPSAWTRNKFLYVKAHVVRGMHTAVLFRNFWYTLIDSFYFIYNLTVEIVLFLKVICTIKNLNFTHLNFIKCVL